MSRFAVIGDPVSHSLSPKMHKAAYEALGLEHSYEAIRVPLDHLDSEVDRLRSEGFAGVNVTVPLKEAAFFWCNPDSFAARAQAINTINLSTMEGINTDGPGMLTIVDSHPRNVLLLGAGGSSRAIALALTEAGHAVTIWNRTPGKAVALAEKCGCEADEAPIIQGFDVVINATSASMKGELPELLKASGTPSPSSAQCIRTSGGEPVAIDLYYSHETTIFMDYFARIGWRTMDGRELLVAQGALAFEYWLGIPAPVAVMRAAVGL